MYRPASKVVVHKCVCLRLQIYKPPPSPELASDIQWINSLVRLLPNPLISCPVWKPAKLLTQNPVARAHAHELWIHWLSAF
jgi:hypothetical protein